MGDLEIGKSESETLRTLFAKTISIGKYSLLFNIDQSPDSKAKRYVFTFRKLIKKINGDLHSQGISSKGIFIVSHLKNIRLGFFNRHQIIEKLD